MVMLVTGPVRSGKSRFALELARERSVDPIYVATAQIDPADGEMMDRVARHRAERGAMRSIETDESRGPRLTEVLRDACAGEVLVVDSLGTWLSSLLVAYSEDALRRAAADDLRAADRSLEREADALVAALAATAADVVIVAEETGWGVVPAFALGRAFRDHLGRLTARLASSADHAYLVVAGYAVDLRAIGRRVSDP
jgi:adenosylcobinamide kinase/adenosylcobinamide-phosphate guanylyltransferase